MRQPGAGNRQANRLRAGGQQQTIIGDRLSAGRYDMTCPGVDFCYAGIEAQVDVSLGIEVLRLQRNPVLRRAAREIILRQIGPVDRRIGLLAEHDDLSAKILPPQHFSSGKACRAAANDDNPLRNVGWRFRRWLWLSFRLQLFLYEDLAVALLDAPARQRAECGRTRRFSGAQIEAGMMPWATDAAVNDDPIGQRPMVVAAICVNS